MPKIIFVDDDVNVLNGLRRMLRPMRNEWQIAFAEHGCEALAILDRESFDIVVTDMRMPSMNGAELLGEVLRRHPHVVRIILSGQADLQSALAGIGLAHQYLSKPTEPTTLLSVLKRAVGLLTLVPDRALRRRLNSLRSLPSAPCAYSKLMGLVRAPVCDAGSLAEIVAFDMGLAAKTLQIAGSAFINSPCRAANVWRAVHMLGPDMMRSLALNTEVFTDLSTLGCGLDRAAIAEILDASSCRARLVELGAGDRNAVEEATTFELLKDLGKAALTIALGSEGTAIELSSPDDGNTVTREAKDRMRMCHAQAGAYMMGLWGLPETLSEAISAAADSIASHILTGIDLRLDANYEFAEIPG